MLEKLRKFFSAPVFEDEGANFNARNLNFVLLSVFVGIAITILRYIALGKFWLGNAGVVFLVTGAIIVGAYILFQRRYILASSIVAISVLTLMPFLLILMSGNGIHDTAIMILPVAVVITSMLLPWQGLIGYILLVAFAFGVLVRMEVNYHLITPFSSLTTNSDFTDVLTILAAAGLMSGLLVASLRRNLRRLGDALQERKISEERYRAVVENQTEFIVRWKPDGTRTFVNDAYCQHFGIAADDAISTSFFPLLSDEDRLATSERISRMLSGTIETESYVQCVNKSGGVVSWQEWTDQIVHDESGQVIEFQSVGRDITDRKRMEEALRESEAEYRMLVDHVPNAVIYLDSPNPDIGTYYVSPQIKGMLGYSPEEWIANPKSWTEHIFPEDRERVLAADARHDKSGEPFSQDYRMIARDGRVVWIRDQGAAVLDDIGQPRFSQGIMIDITERKQAEEALRKSEERYRLISTLSTDYVFSSTVHKDGTITHDWESGAFESISGYTPEEFRAHGGWRATVHPDDLEIDSQLLEKLKSNQKASGEMRVITKNEATRWIKDYVHPVWDAQEHRLVGIYGAVQDITERKFAEEKLRQQAEQMSALYDIGLAITSNLDLGQTLRHLCDQCRKLLPIDTFYVAIYDETLNIVSHPLFYEDNRYISVPDRNVQVQPGLSGSVILSKATLYLPDKTIPEVEQKYKMVKTSGTVCRSYVGVPMIFREKTIGVISMQKFESDAYSPEQIRLLETIATQAAVAIENARLYQSEQERRREAETLRESLASIVTTFDLEEVVERILDQIKFVIPYDTASVWRVDGEWLKPIVGRDIPPEISLAEMKLHLDHDISSRPLIRGEKPFILNNNVQEELPDFRGPHSYINSWLAVPLKKRGKIIGQIGLDGRRKGQFTAHHAELAVTFADQVAIALENASLYTEIQQELIERKLAEEKLYESERRFRMVLDNLGEGVAVQDNTWRYTYANPAAHAIVGLPPGTLIGAHEDLIISPPRKELGVQQNIRRARGEISSYETDLIRPNGDIRTILATGVPRLDEQKQLIETFVTFTDITERKQAEEKIQQLNTELENRVAERTAQLNEANQNLHQEKVRLEQYSRQRELMGTMTDLLQASLTTDEASGIVSRYMQLLFPNRDGALYLLNASGTLEPSAIWGEQKSLDTMFSMNDCWALRRGKPYRFGGGLPNPPCVHVGREITQSALCIPLTAQGESMGSLHISTESIGDGGLMDGEEQRFIETIADSVALALANVRLRERLRIQSIRDGLTGLFNRRYLDETLPREIHRAERNQRPISVLMFDIDSFKKFNDTYGHDAGDVVLKRIAELILSKVRPSDIACRYGGEEFTIILPDTSLEIARARAESLREAAAQMGVQHNGKDLGTITISIGVAAYPQHGITRDVLIKVADEASYQAKETGKNRVIVASLK